MGDISLNQEKMYLAHNWSLGCRKMILMQLLHLFQSLHFLQQKEFDAVLEDLEAHQLVVVVVVVVQ